MLIGRLEQAVQFVNQLFLQAPQMREFFDQIFSDQRCVPARAAGSA